jgi:FtsP/CotA-like multicopper oxidase with cupredoxin domain
MSNSCFSKFARLILTAAALSASVGIGVAQAPKVPVSNPNTAVVATPSGTRCTTMRCVTNADRVAAASRAAARRVAATQNTRGKSKALFASPRAVSGATAIPVQPGCNAPVADPRGVPDYMSGCVGNNANSWLPVVTGTVAPVSVSSAGVWSGPTVNGSIAGGLRKFVDLLPSIPVAVPDQITYASTNSDYYEIELIETLVQMHADLPNMTRVRMYHQTNGGPAASYLGPLIIAQKGRPVRIKFTNKLQPGAGGNLFIPVDTTVMGSGMGADGTPYLENRSGIHLHGGNTPWISDGTPHQWTVPALDAGNTSHPKGVSTTDVPDMPPTNPGEMTIYYTNDQSARLMFYHDHAYGITRLNVYAGVAAGYLLQDPIENAMVNGGTVPLPGGGAFTGTKGSIPADQIPLIIQDKTFVPPADQLAAQDPTWGWGSEAEVASKNFLNGSLWFPHVYMPNQNPSDDSGANGMGRWDWGPWFWPPMDTSTLVAGAQEWACPTSINPGQTCPGLPNPSLTPESFMDTPVVNGKAYPVLKVNPQAYRLRILNASNDRSWNLSLYKGVDSNGALCVGLPGIPASGVNACSEVRHISPPDGIAGQGPIPDPSTKGPQMIQIGTEAGFIPKAVTHDNQPIVYNYNRRDIVVLNVAQKNLWLGPAERADVIVDFSQYAGQTLILYNDSPAPVPAFDTRFDYYTGDPDQTLTGGAPTTLPGYGPNTRTVMQIQVADTGNGVAFDPTNLNATLPAAFAASQPAPVIPEPEYAAAFPTITQTNHSYGRIQDTSLFTGSVTGISVNTAGSGYTVAPTVTIGAPAAVAGATQATAVATIGSITVGTTTVTGAVTGITITNPGVGYYSTPLITITRNASDTTGKGASANAVGLPMLRKTIQELFELNYGRMNATLGTELPLTSFNVQTTVPLGYIDTPTESFVDGTPQIWKITHNGVDTHAIHFHLFNVQVINRVGWDGAVRAPDANEIGWKETVKMSPLEDVIVAFKPMHQNLPFSLPDSIRPQDVTSAPGASILLGDLAGAAARMQPNAVINYGQEYVWHCHLLGHEENDMMRPMIFQVAPDAPANLSPLRVGQTSTVNISFTNKSAAVVQSNALANTTGYTLQRDIKADYSTAVNIASITPALGTAVGSTVLYQDTSAPSGPSVYYRVQAFTPNGYSTWATAQIQSPPAAAISTASLAFGYQIVGVPSTTQNITLSNTGAGVLNISGITISGGGDFTQTGCGSSLAASTGTCTITVTFNPTTVGARNGTISIASNDPVNPNLTVSLTGTGATSATMVSPVSNSTLPTGQFSFTWIKPGGVSGVYIWVGTTSGGSNLANTLVTGTSMTFNAPANGAPIYVRLTSVIPGKPNQAVNYTYTAPSAPIISTYVASAMISPQPSATFTSSTVTFTWSTATGPTGSGAPVNYIWIGTTPGSNNLANRGPFPSNTLTITLPKQGNKPIYVTLTSIWRTTGASISNSYTYTAK